ncbi:MAG TPA: hypothetical protein P5158_06475 [Chitinophagaceae bacterium]|nr:hypothetical protein [Chitinophagaceae bacterium]MCB9056083.1 hypothetical protein [Chitinophagales bacterium]HRX93738.1 hypothetical protein [Chitinophagaceae bacterium]
MHSKNGLFLITNGRTTNHSSNYNCSHRPISCFFKSYFQEKGKNIATKEDIEEITEKIETIKSEVELLTHKKISISTEKHKTLLDFNSQYSAWLNYILHATIGGDNDKPDEYVQKIAEKLDQLYHDFLITEAKLEVFFNGDDELLELQDDIKLKTMTLSNHLSTYPLKAKGTSHQIRITNQLPDGEYKRGQYKKYLDESLVILDEYQKEKLKQFRILSPMNHRFIKMISDRLMNIGK